jgi:PhnB protein
MAMASTIPTLRSTRVPAGHTAVTPWVISRDTAKLLEFAKRAFGAEELRRVHNEDGSIGHAELKIGDSIVMAFDARPDWGRTRGFLRLYVDDCDAVFRQALEAGATPVTEMTDLAFGERVARVRDPLGNIWWIHAVVEKVSPEEIQRRFEERKYLEAMAYVQSTLDKALSAP